MTAKVPLPVVVTVPLLTIKPVVPLPICIVPAFTFVAPV